MLKEKKNENQQFYITYTFAQLQLNVRNSRCPRKHTKGREQQQVMNHYRDCCVPTTTPLSLESPAPITQSGLTLLTLTTSNMRSLPSIHPLLATWHGFKKWMIVFKIKNHQKGSIVWCCQCLGTYYWATFLIIHITLHMHIKNSLFAPPLMVLLTANLVSEQIVDSILSNRL